MPPLDNPRHERFYVYAVRIDGRTRYIGKGCGKRALTRSHNDVLAAEVASAKARGLPVRVRLIKAGLTEIDAYRLERRLIFKWADKLANAAMGVHPQSRERR